MTIKEMQERKKELGLTYAQIAERSGLPVGTVQKVLGGITQTPRYDTIMALESVLGEEQPMAVRESAVPYNVKKQGEYTLEDYYQFPDDVRLELIDGVIYDTLTATVDKKFTFGAPGDPSGYEETLYVTKDGKFFVYTYGGKKSKYPEEAIMPIEREHLKEWMLSRGKTI